jgi:hypothetical protein
MIRAWLAPWTARLTLSDRPAGKPRVSGHATIDYGAGAPWQRDHLYLGWRAGGVAGPSCRIVRAVRAILVGLLVAALAVWLLPFWLTLWVVGIGVLVWAYFCVVQSGYPVIPTYAWAVPVAIASVAGLLIPRPWGALLGLLGMGFWIALYLSSAVRRFWYVTLFRWRPGSG